METLKFSKIIPATNQPHTWLLRRIRIAVARAFDAFKEPELIPVPTEKYTPSRDVVENFCARRGIREGILTQWDHDKLINSLRGYNFSDAIIAETRLRSDAHNFWNTDLPPLSK